MNRIQRLLIGGRAWATGDESLQAALQEAHDADERPLCLCQPEGIPMYVSRHGRYLVKRMPQSGPRHHPQCVSYQPAPSDTGRGDLLEHAVAERPGGGLILQTAFAWEGRTGHPQPGGGQVFSTGVRRDQRLMSLQGLMYFLFERAGFHRWSPAMAGKRTQAVLCKYLMRAAQGVWVPVGALSERLYVPEAYDHTRRIAQAERRRAILSTCEVQGSRHPLALVIGELKRWASIPSGGLMWIRHMPEVSLRVEALVWQQMQQLYAPLLQARQTCEGRGLRHVLAALVGQPQTHLLEVERASLMFASPEWIPLEGQRDLPLLQALVEQQRYFLKPLTHDATSHTPADFLLLDAGDRPVPLHVIDRSMTRAEVRRKLAATREGRQVAWLWDTGEPMPHLPDPVAKPRSPPVAAVAARSGRWRSGS